MAFLVMAFVLVGLAGLFATYAIPVPLQRALVHEAALDEVLTAAQSGGAAAAIERLAPLLGDSAAKELQAEAENGITLTAAVARQRAAMRADFEAEEDQIALRVRVLIGVITIAGALFGAAVLSVVRRSR